MVPHPWACSSSGYSHSPVQGRRWCSGNGGLWPWGGQTHNTRVKARESPERALLRQCEWDQLNMLDSSCLRRFPIWFSTWESCTKKPLRSHLPLLTDQGVEFIALYCTLELNVFTAPSNQSKRVEKGSQSVRYRPPFPPARLWFETKSETSAPQKWVAESPLPLGPGYHQEESPTFQDWRAEVLGLHEMQNKEF